MVEPSCALPSAQMGQKKGGSCEIRGKVTVPVHRWDEANNMLAEKLGELKRGTWNDLQEEYDRFEAILKEGVEEVELGRIRPITDDKISLNMKNLIRRRTELRCNSHLDKKDRVELCKLKKATKRGVRQDLRVFDERLMQDIIRENWSTKKVKKALVSGKNILPSIKERWSNKMFHDREKIIKEVCSFFK